MVHVCMISQLLIVGLPTLPNKLYLGMAYIKAILFLFCASSCMFNLLCALPTKSLASLELKSCAIDKLYLFGASLCDTGNQVVEIPDIEGCYQDPYGESFFGEPTGRCSDGLLTFDFVASAIGLPFLNPYLHANASFISGVNFAVNGATALPANTIYEKGIVLHGTNSSLGVQLDWFSTHITSLCGSNKDCRHKSLKNSLFVFGETGGNDFGYGLLQGKTMEEMKAMVPEVYQSITDTVRRLIKLGAAQIVLTANLPVGCFPALLTVFGSNNPAGYDKHQCLKDLNEFTILQNEHLQVVASRLQEENPNIKIVYADLYKTFLSILNDAANLGFDATAKLKACCGTGGRYQFSAEAPCAPDVPVCPDPSLYISWDGLHLTQKAYEWVAKWFVADILSQFKCYIPVLDH